MDVLYGVVLALFVPWLALRLYPWRHKPAQQRSRLAASVALGASFGLYALGHYLTHRFSWSDWALVGLAVMFPVVKIRKARREK